HREPAAHPAGGATVRAALAGIADIDGINRVPPAHHGVRSAAGLPAPDTAPRLRLPAGGPPTVRGAPCRGASLRGTPPRGARVPAAIRGTRGGRAALPGLGGGAVAGAGAAARDVQRGAAGAARLGRGLRDGA